MKNSVLLSLLGVALYTLSGVVSWGYHAMLLPLFLTSMAVVSYFINRKKSQNIVKNLLWTALPILLLLLVTSLFLGESPVAKLVNLYILFTPLVLVGVYFLLKSTSQKAKIGYGLAVFSLIVLSVFAFDILKMDMGSLKDFHPLAEIL